MLETPVGRDVIDMAEVASIPSEVRHDVDLLFVVDDTRDMAGVQARLIDTWRRIRGHLAFADGGFPTVHLAVVSSDLGVGAAQVPGCTATGDDGRLVTGAGGAPWLTVTLDDPAAADAAFAGLARLGEAGCAFEQPLAAMRRALDGTQPANDGFLRPEAALGVVFVAGDDDCSIDDPAFFADGDAPLGKFRCFREGVHCDDDAVPEGPQSGCAPRASSAVMADVDDEAGFLRALKADPAAVTVTTLAGEPDRVALARTGDGLEVSPACTDAVNDVTPRPGIRLGAFAGRMRGSVAGLCEQTLEEAGTPAGLDLRRALGHRCLEGRILDVKPWEPGVQFQCEVEAVSAGGEVTALAACPNPNHVFDEDGPCWAIKPGPAQCGDFPSQLALQVNWGGDDKLTTPPGVTTRVRCAVEDDDPLD